MEHLDAGRDVVMAQYFGRLGYIVVLEDLAREHGATFVEVILATGAALAIDRFRARRRAMTERGEDHPERDIADADVEAFILDAVDRLTRLPTARPGRGSFPLRSRRPKTRSTAACSRSSARRRGCRLVGCSRTDGPRTSGHSALRRTWHRGAVGDEDSLAGGWQTDVRRVGNVVVRSAKPQSRTVVALLHHLHHSGFDGSPEPIGDGFTTDGREQLEYVEGESPHPGPWTEADAWRLGDLVRRLHDTTAMFVARRLDVAAVVRSRSASRRHCHRSRGSRPVEHHQAN